MGDPRGIGPEVVLRSIAAREISSLGNIILIGDRRLLKQRRFPVVDIPYKDPGEGSLRFLERGIDLIKGGIADALVTAPLSKEAVSRYHKGFRGHTEYLADSFGVKRFDMMFVSGKMRMSLVTRHVPLKDVSAAINKDNVLSSIELLNQTLKEKFNIKRPKIAVWGLNPHAGEGGLLGSEEDESIIPAIKKALKKGVDVRGPFPADTFFVHDKGFDGIVAMYHDQGLTPVKAIYFNDLVNFTAGLPFIRTSPVHGTAFDIAGKGLADPASMKAAIRLAFELS